MNDETTVFGKVIIAGQCPVVPADPAVDAIVQDIIGKVADKWTMLVIEVLTVEGRLRFTRLCGRLPGISQKMLTQTLRQLESDGLVSRTVYPVVPPRVEYELTAIGHTLSAAFCGVWLWAEQNQNAIVTARQMYRDRKVHV